MSNRILQLVIVAVLLGATVWAQNPTPHYAVPAASIDEQFAAYHNALSGAADNLLTAASAQRPGGQATSGQGCAPSSCQQPANNSSSSSDGDAVRRFAASYWNGQDGNVRRAMERVAALRPLVEPILREEGVPIELAAIMLVESGGRTTALSPKGARGPWQFMPETARRYGLDVSFAQDERVDVVKSTRAAARYLRDLYQRFGDWQLALAGYNAGENMVQRAIDRTRSRSFLMLASARSLPLETQNYVPAVLSALELLGGRPQNLAVRRLMQSGRRPIHTTSGRGDRVLFADATSGN